MFLIGILIVLIVLYDFLRTVISLSGLGIISRGVTCGLWRFGSQGARWMETRTGRSIRGLLGPSILCALAGVWILLHLLGYTLIYLSGRSLVDSGSGEPATLVQTIAFAGSALSTLGASKVQVTGGWWDVISMIAAMNGMIVLTLSVSFILNVLQTTMSARAFAARYHALLSRTAPRSRTEMLARVSSLGPEMCRLAVQITASPLPGVFVPDDPTMDFPATITKLCDLLESEGLRFRPDAMEEEDVSQLRWGLGLLGRNTRTDGDQGDFAAARAWARRHTFQRSQSQSQSQSQS